MKKFKADDYGYVDEAVVEAFSYCRDVNHPVIVMIDDHKCKLFPSGRMEDLDTGKVNNDIDW